MACTSGLIQVLSQPSFSSTKRYDLQRFVKRPFLNAQARWMSVATVECSIYINFFMLWSQTPSIFSNICAAKNGSLFGMSTNNHASLSSMSSSNNACSLSILVNHHAAFHEDSFHLDLLVTFSNPTLLWKNDFLNLSGCFFMCCFLSSWYPTFLFSLSLSFILAQCDGMSIRHLLSTPRFHWHIPCATFSDSVSIHSRLTRRGSLHSLLVLLTLFQTMPALHNPDKLHCCHRPRCQQTTRRIFSAHPLEFLQLQSSAMVVPLLLCQMRLFCVSFNSRTTTCRGVPHKLSQFVASHASLNSCLVQLLPRTTPDLGDTKLLPLDDDSLSHTACKWTDTIISNFTDPNFPSVLHLRPVRISSLFFPCVPQLMLFLIGDAMRGSHLSSGLSPAVCRFSADIRSVMHCRSRTTLGQVITFGWVRRTTATPAQSPPFESISCSVRYRISKWICENPDLWWNEQEIKDEVCCGSFPFTTCKDNSELETRLHCLVSWNSNRKQRWESSFVSPLHQAIQFDVVHRFHDLQHKQCANFCRQHVHNLHVGVQACPGNFCFQGLFLLISTSLRDTSIG